MYPHIPHHYMRWTPSASVHVRTRHGPILIIRTCGFFAQSGVGISDGVSFASVTPLRARASSYRCWSLQWPSTPSPLTCTYGGTVNRDRPIRRIATVHTNSSIHIPVHPRPRTHPPTQFFRPCSPISTYVRTVLIVDKCPESWAGGNGYFTAGAHRTAHAGLHDLLPLLANASPALRPSPARLASIDVEPYPERAFADDVHRLGSGRADTRLVEVLAAHSRDTVGWLGERVRMPFVLSFNRQAYEVAGRMQFWGGMALSVEDGGKGLIHAWERALKEVEVERWFGARAVEILAADMAAEGGVRGIIVRRGEKEVKVRTKSVVLAAGGFEASEEMRKAHLGEEWANARVRGTPYNTGDGFELARSLGAKTTGDWAGCHSTAWDANAALDGGNRDLTNQYTKSGYPLGIMVNLHGQRFVDEGEDFRNYTYAKFGRAILAQKPEGCAFQVWDAKVLDRLREEEYADDVVKKVWANSVQELAEELGQEEWGLKDKQHFIQTILQFNEAVRTAAAAGGSAAPEWNPAVKDGRTTQSEKIKLAIPKSNWALTVEDKPLMAVKVACGITFTFGGVAIDPDTAGVLSEHTGGVIPGLFCAGEMVGGLFYGNYPGGSGLTAGAVFGKKAGEGAAKRSAVTS